MPTTQSSIQPPTAPALPRRSSGDLSDLRADLDRYTADYWVTGPVWWIGEPSIWAVAVYRAGRALVSRSPRPLHPLIRWLWRLPTSALARITGVHLSPTSDIGPGLRIHHGRGLRVGDGVMIGARGQLRHGVRLAALHPGAPAPVLGDDVELGAYAQVLGGVNLGNGARVGAHAVVVSDVPTGATAVGVPATVLPRPQTVA